LSDLFLQVDLPQQPLAEVVVVVDPHPGPFLRQLATANTNNKDSSSSSSSKRSACDSDCLPRLLQQLQQLQELGWIDRVVLADATGCDVLKVLQ
jgi:hypothetical protein